MLQNYLIYFEYVAFFFNFVFEFMRRLKKKIFLGSFGLCVGFLAVVRACRPEVVRVVRDGVPPDSLIAQKDMEIIDKPAAHSALSGMQSQPPVSKAVSRKSAEAACDTFVYHPIKGVLSYKRCFPDLQDVQMVAAQQWGVPAIADREEAEMRKTELVFVGANPYFDIDSRMNLSIPYLVPRAGVLLQRIGRSFMDSLCVKGLPMHKLIVTSVLRTDDDVKKLQRRNLNAMEQSCHRHGTTFDIAYGRYSPVETPETPAQRTVGDDTLKWVLSEVLRDFREQGSCYIKYEQKQGCFHITVR